MNFRIFSEMKIYNSRYFFMMGMLMIIISIISEISHQVYIGFNPDIIIVP